jgi:hypothetical protein
MPSTAEDSPHARGNVDGRAKGDGGEALHHPACVVRSVERQRWCVLRKPLPGKSAMFRGQDRRINSAMAMAVNMVMAVCMRWGVCMRLP